MNRREFIIRMGAALVSVPVVLSLQSCGSDNGGSTPDGFDVVSSSNFNHTHTARILTADLTSPPSGGVVYTSSLDGGHDHTITLTQQQLTDINNNLQVSVVSSTDNAHTHTWTIQKP